VKHGCYSKKPIWFIAIWIQVWINPRGEVWTHNVLFQNLQLSDHVFINEVIKTHNVHRKKHQAPPLRHAADLTAHIRHNGAKKKLQLKHKNSLFTLQTFHCNNYWWSQSLLNRFGWEGSILAPLLFNVFINDIFYSVKKGTLYNYADDNTLSYGHPDFNVLTSVLESESNVLLNWFKVISL
jgi:hypothetical protein